MDHAMDDAPSLWSTLHSVTSIKRQELAKQRDACRSLRVELLKPLEQEADARTRVRLLLQDAGKRVAMDSESLARRRGRKKHQMRRKKVSSQHDEILKLAGLSAANIQRYLEQSEEDPSIPSAFFSSIEDKFRVALRAQEIKYEYATLFSDLVTERSSEQSKPGAEPVGEFEPVGRNEMQEQREEWESRVFEPLVLDEKHILNTLAKVFSSPEAVQALEVLRQSVEAECELMLRPNSVNVQQMKLNVQGLIASDLLSDDQTAILKQVVNSPSWLSEMVDVLNLRLAAIDRWTWETEAVPLEMRRQLNGKYRVFMHEEITQALLIYHIGINFATSLANSLDQFHLSAGWKKHAGVGRAEQAKYDYFIGQKRAGEKNSIQADLDGKFENDYFMSVLPRTASEGAGGYGDDALNDAAQDSRVSQSVETKQQLLRIIAAETLFADNLKEELVVLQTDFRWFGPSLSHSAIMAVLKFFGVSKTWLGFFERFLRAPMRFVQDGPSGAIRIRERGVPMSHVLSDVFGEMVLFCVDFAVNEATGGKPMFRLHDDIWLWGSSKETVAAWGALTSMTKLMGMSLNKDKTGTARLTRNEAFAKQPLPKSLPGGPLRWGLLSVQQSGHFEIDQEKIDEHIVEFRRQLASRKSVLAWIKAYNSYMKFFSLHFCHPAGALGRRHIDNCLSTLRRVHQALFPKTNGNAAAHVKRMITSRYQVADIPDGFVYFPMILGGLELHNPFIALQSMRDMVLGEPMEEVSVAREDEAVEYRRLKELFKKSGPADRTALPQKPTEFLSEEDYTLYWRSHSYRLFLAWEELLQPALEESAEITADTTALLDKMPLDQRSQSPIRPNGQDSYWNAVLELCAAEMGQVFGGVQIVEKGLLAMGMVDLFKGKVRWEA